MVDPFAHALTDEAALRALYAPPSALVASKEIDRLDHHCRAFLACCPFVVVSSADREGRCDATPRGGAPGFVTVLDDHMLAIPDATGNRRIDTLRNVVATGYAGLLFLIPGRGQTLRVNGRACVTTHPDVLDRLTGAEKPTGAEEPPAAEKAPAAALIVQAEEVFTHCPKAFARSGLWQPQRWLDERDQPSAAAMLRDHVGDPGLSLAEAARQMS